jgi:hypothetical protein
MELILKDQAAALEETQFYLVGDPFLCNGYKFPTQNDGTVRHAHQT